jgi:penicillin amidase
MLQLTACREAPSPPLLPDLSGTYAVPGLSAPVRVVRDRWGVPHIYAQTTGDLFVAQGFVQAQDRLFQMDLWRRSVQGRLAEVLGPNFIERDAMTRRMQFRGYPVAEWAHYSDDAKAIAEGFVRGINAWVTRARDRPPESFALAGWKPDFWSPDDLLNRIDAFIAAGDAIDEIRRAGMSDVIADAIRSVGAAPFFAGGAAVDPRLVGVRSIGRVSAMRSGSLALAEAGRRLDQPSRRYLVHLNAPGWNVIGATAPWRPGVAIGHNDRIAWGTVQIDADTQDVLRDDSTIVRSSREYVVVKGRDEPFTFDRSDGTHGVIVAADFEHRSVFTVRWTGTEPGTAPELASLAIDRARNWTEFRDAVARWKTPAVRFAYADTDGNIGSQDAALIPIRGGGEWTGWRSFDDLPHAFNPPGDAIAAADASRDQRSTVSAQALFAHPLAVTAARRQRFNIGPLARPADDDSPLRAVFDAKDWDRSRAINAPGQSESPVTAHFSDLAALWSAGEAFPLAFSDGAVQANASATLTLVSARDGARPR